MDIRRRVGLKIKAERQARGWSQEELADRADMHRTYVSGIERGKRNPTLTNLEKLSIAFKTPIGHLTDV